MAGQARTVKAAFTRILCWLVDLAAYLKNRCDIGSDGKTPLHRLHGRRDRTDSGILPKQQEEESGTRDSIVEYPLEC